MKSGLTEHPVRRGRARIAFSLALLLALLTISCGAAQEGLGPDTPVDFSFTYEGKTLHLSMLRRRPLILVLMRTSEVVSQIYIQKVSEAFKQTAGELRYLVLTIEPGEAPFVESYASFEKLPFSIGVAEPGVVVGASALGTVPGVPCTYFIDAEGKPEKVIPGVIETDALIKLAKRFSKR